MVFTASLLDVQFACVLGKSTQRDDSIFKVIRQIGKVATQSRRPKRFFRCLLVEIP